MQRNYGENQGTTTKVVYEADGPRLVSPADPYVKRMFEEDLKPNFGVPV